jgi:hypothetical protein
MEGQSIDDLVTYAIGKLQGGLSQEQVAANMREMLVAEKWPALAIEATLGQVEARLREKERQEQPDPSAVMMEMMRQMMNRMQALESQRTTPTPLPTRVPTPPQTLQESDRSKYPDPERFDGDRNKYPQFRYETMAKLRHSYAHKSHAYQIDYIVGRTKDRASKVVLPWVEKNVLSATVEDMWAYMDRQFKDPYQKARALDKLRHLSQGKRLVRDYISEFNQLLQESEQTFEEDTLKSMLSEGLKTEVRKHLIMVPEYTSFDQFCNEAIKVSDQLYRIGVTNRERIPSRSQSTSREHVLPSQTRRVSPEPMDWQPTSSNQSSTRKQRARRVSNAEIQRRRENRLCIRCGAGGHFIPTCPYLPPTPLSPVQAAKATVPQASILPLLELESDTESDQGKE